MIVQIGLILALASSSAFAKGVVETGKDHSKDSQSNTLGKDVRVDANVRKLEVDNNRKQSESTDAVTDALDEKASTSKVTQADLVAISRLKKLTGPAGEVARSKGLTNDQIMAKLIDMESLNGKGVTVHDLIKKIKENVLLTESQKKREIEKTQEEARTEIDNCEI